MKNLKLAIIVSDYNEAITEKLCAGAYSTLLKSGLTDNQITVHHVPGAVEIPLIAKLLATKNQYDAIICLGAVIQGETDHYDYVCQQVSNGCQAVMLQFMIPVIFGVLTTQNLKQAKDRVNINKSHKGVEAAETALHMIKLLSKINCQPSLETV